MRVETKEWPIGFDALTHGDSISVETIESAFDLKRTDPMFKIRAQLALVEMIRTRRPDLDSYVRSKGFDVIIMDHHEASRHQRARFVQTARQMLVSHRRTMGVDSSQLEESERARHERDIYANGRIISAIRDTRRQLRLEATKRTLPIPLKE